MVKRTTYAISAREYRQDRISPLTPSQRSFPNSQSKCSRLTTIDTCRLSNAYENRRARQVFEWERRSRNHTARDMITKLDAELRPHVAML